MTDNASRFMDQAYGAYAAKHGQPTDAQALEQAAVRVAQRGGDAVVSPQAFADAVAQELGQGEPSDPMRTSFEKFGGGMGIGARQKGGGDAGEESPEDDFSRELEEHQSLGGYVARPKARS